METSIIPHPSSVEALEGHWRLPESWSVSAQGPGTEVQAEYLLRELPRHLGRPCEGRRTSKKESGIHLRIDPRTADTSHEEGYELEIVAKSVEIRASTVGGLFYGIQSFLQVIAGGPEQVPCQRVLDEPRFRWRGMHLDVCRHFFTVDEIKRFLDLLALHKLNTFHWHLTEDQGWRLPVDEYPLLTEISAWRSEEGRRYGGWYTESDIRDVVDYAAARRIRVLPEVEMPGHSVAALAAYPELSCTGGPFEVETKWGIFDDVYCAGNDDVFSFMKTVLEQVMRLFPCEYIHIGGDECPKTRWKTCARCQKRMKREKLASEEELQSWFIQQISKFLEQNGRILVGWDEILEGGLAPGATVMSWRGMDGGIDAAQEGHDVIMSPTSHCYFDYRQEDDESELGAHGVVSLEEVYSLEPVPEKLSVEQKTHVLGAQGNVWTERMHTFDDVQYMVLPRMAALAEAVWSAKSRRDWASFSTRLSSLAEIYYRLGYVYRKKSVEQISSS